jgi:hypothetical protein
MTYNVAGYRSHANDDSGTALAVHRLRLEAAMFSVYSRWGFRLELANTYFP